MVLRAGSVDPRDVNIEVDEPTFRVYFWTEARACREFEVEGADVDRVIAWADANAREDETYTLHVVSRELGDTVLTRIKGVEPQGS